MTRTLPALLALAAATATMSLATPATPARADGGTYADLTSIAFRDAAGDAPAPVDLRSGDVSLDPNWPYFRGELTFGADNDQGSFAVLRLGEVVSGACEPRVEVVSNRAFGVVVRDPGEATLPRDVDGPGQDEVYFHPDDPRLELVPTCAVLDVVDVHGVVLDTADGVVTHTEAGRGLLKISSETEMIVNVDSGVETQLAYEIVTGSGPIYDATIDAVAGDSGLVLGHTHFDLDTVGGPRGPTSDIRRVRITATPGLHLLTLRFAGGNAATSEVTVRIWGRGGPKMAGRDSLAGQVFLSEEIHSEPSAEAWKEWTTYSFLDDTWVRLTERTTLDRTPSAPYEPCFRRTERCQRYAYDARTGAMQIGEDAGELRDGVLRFNGVHDHRAQLPRAGSTVAFVGRNLFRAGFWTAGFRLTLRKDGTFVRWTHFTAPSTNVTQRGRYRIGPRGLLVARTSTGKVLRTGLALLVDAQGRPRPHTLGVYAFDVWFHPARR